MSHEQIVKDRQEESRERQLDRDKQQERVKESCGDELCIDLTLSTTPNSLTYTHTYTVCECIHILQYLWVNLI